MVPSYIPHFRFKCRGEHLDKKDFFGKSDPYFKMYRVHESGEGTLEFESETIVNTLDPVWSIGEVSLQKICNGDIDRTIRIEVYDWDQFSKHDLM